MAVESRPTPGPLTAPDRRGGRVDAADDRAYCRQMLPAVSRTFALCIRLLPAELEHPVLLAYLLCRIADTIEDAPDLPGADKADLLMRFRACVDEEPESPEAIAARFAARRNAEEDLAYHADRVLREFERLPDAQRAAIRPWVREMCEGMADFAARRDRDELAALETVEDLERYCYYVAGTVGHLLTNLLVVVRRDVTANHHAQLTPLAVNFGLGLQLTNIIKDVADDRARGWSFVPAALCAAEGLRPVELTDPAHAVAGREVMYELIARADRYLTDALTYCTRLPRTAYGMRMFCLTALYFAVRTLRQARRDPRLLDAGHKVKITRGEVYRTVAVAALVAPANWAVRAYHGWLRRFG